MKSHVKKFLSDHLKNVLEALPWDGLSGEDIWLEAGGDEVDDVPLEEIIQRLDALVDEGKLQRSEDKYQWGPAWE